jgi:YYY domain-containing protein
MALTTWDGTSYLHPDERFIIFTAYNLQVPRSFSDYLRSNCAVNGRIPAARATTDGAGNPLPLNQQEPTRDSGCNTLNPRNYNWSRFFVYGTLPTTVTRLAVELQANLSGQPDRISPEMVRDTGRTLSMLYDLGTIVVVFLIGRRLFDRRTGLIASLLYATAAFPIQISHFFTVDAATTFFATLSIYWAVRIAQGGGAGSAIGAGLSIGAAVACRVTLATLGLAVIVAAFARLVEETRRQHAEGEAPGMLARLLAAPGGLLFALAWRVALAGVVTVVAFRLLQPDAFTGPSLFDVRPEPRFLDNISSVGRLVSGEADFPPSQQWAQRTPFLFSLQNMALWGMGLPLGIAAWVAWGVAGWRILRRGDMRLIVPWVWIAFYFAWQGGQFVMTMRYYVLLYGLLIVLAAGGLLALWDRAQRVVAARWRRLAWRAPLIVAVAGTALWACAFTRIYTEPHSRIQASRWIYQNIPPGAVITFERWDDPLPLPIDGQNPGQYIGIGTEPYGEDEPLKYYGYISSDGSIAEGLLDQLDRADYLIFSSNRVYDSATRLPMRYPALTRYYYHLFEGNLGFELVADIHSFPKLFGIEIPTPILAEEAFSVYDHPRVLIFRKTSEYSRTKAEQLILGDVAWGEVYKITTLRVNKAPTALRLTQDQWTLYHAAGDWATLFNPASLANAAPWLFWLLALEAIGLACFALLFRSLAALPDRGYALSKILGLLIVSYVPWLLASVGPAGAHGTLRAPLVPFGTWSVALCAVAFAGAGALALRWNRAALVAFWRQRRAAILTAEGVFLALFFGFLLLRALNPDLWHPARGGEKPMDLAFLTAVVKSPAFPPYDPWFAGGYLNYYYFGFVLVATLIHLTGIVPTTAYNLAVPTFAALTAIGAWGAAYNLVALRKRLALHPALEPQPRIRWQRLFATVASQSAVWRTYERRAIAAGVAAAIFAALAGNLAQAVWFFPGTGNPQDAGLPEACRTLASYAAQQDCRGRAEWAFWDATRLVAMALGDGTITEFPFFTFLFADLHAHMLALPLILATLNLIMAAARHPGNRSQTLRSPAMSSLAVVTILLALTVGALYATNTWDYPTAAGLGALGMAGYAWNRYRRGWSQDRALTLWVALTAVLLLLSRLLFLPFIQRFATDYAGFEAWNGARTPASEFLQIHGLWLFLAVSGALALAYRTGRLSARVATAIGGGLIVLAALMAVLGIPALPLQALLLAGGIVLLADLLLRGSVVTPSHAQEAVEPTGPVQLTLPGIADDPPARMPGETLRPGAGSTTLLALLLGLAALGITFMVEVVVAKGDIGRMNTVFKFGMQVWLIFAVVGGVALSWMWAAAAAWRSGALSQGWRAAVALLIAAAFVYPLTATPARLADRYDSTIGPTLDGAAFMRSPRSGWAENDRNFTFAEDAAALEWMRANARGTPIVLEAHLEAYRWGGRVSVYTGLPTLLGWPWHMTQQRSVADAGPVIEARKMLIRDLYNDANARETLRLLRLYGVEYVVVGQLERALYDPAGLAKFDALAAAGQIEIAYSAGETRIYRVPPADHTPAVLTTSLPVRAPAPALQNDLMLPVRVGELPAVEMHGWNRLAGNPAIAVLLWLLAWYALAALGLPLAALVFGVRAPDGGWLWARPIGVLLLGYAIWLPVSARLWQYDVWGMVLGLLLTLAMSGAALVILGRRQIREEAGAPSSSTLVLDLRRGWRVLRDMVRERWRWIAGGEALFLSAFAFLLTLRWLNPDLWQPIWGGEKPFEFGFLNALIRTPVLPPYNPFYSDGIINYYYYGFFLMSLPVRLTGIAPEVAYNLIVPTLFGLMLTAVFAFIVRIRGSWRWGMAGALLVGVAGNLAAVIPANWARGFAPVIASLEEGLPGFGERLGDWFVGPTRVIPSTINEFPYFSFLFADLHPHTIALPLTVLMIALAFEAFVAQPGIWQERLARWGITALTLGALAVTNSWDFPTYGLLLGGALLGRAWRASRRGARRQAVRLGGAALGGMALGGASLALYLPFFQNFRAMVSGVNLVRDTTHLSDYLLLYGIFLAPLVVVLFGAAWQALHLTCRRAQRAHLSTMGASPEATGFVAGAPGATGVGRVPLALLMLTGGIVFVTGAVTLLPPLLLALRLEGLATASGIAAEMLAPLTLRIWLVALLAITAGMAFMRALRPETWFAFWSFGVALIVSLLCEILYVRDHLDGGEWYRMNTVFKFGLQAWVLLAIAATLLLPALLRALRRRDAAAQIVGYGALIALVVLASVYPVVGTASRTAYRFPGNTTGPTLDGLAFMERESFPLPAYLQPAGAPPVIIPLRYDYEAIRWLNQNVRGTPVVLQSSIEFYRAYGVRIAANTGFPTIVSPLHESEQRDPQAVYRRDLDVIQIYRTPDAQEALRLLSRYQVRYVYVGPVERAVYGDAGLFKFQQMTGSFLEVAFRNDQVTIYRINDSVHTMPMLPPLNRPAPAPVAPAPLEEEDGVEPKPVAPVAPPDNDLRNPAVIAELERRNQANPGDAGPAYALAERYRALGRFEDAAAVLRPATRANPNDVALHHLFGDILIDAGRFDEAIEAYRTAVRASPVAGNYNKLGVGLLTIGRPGDAEREFLQAITVDPTLPEPYFRLGTLYEQRGDERLAIQRYREYLEIAPDGYLAPLAREALGRLTLAP